MEVQKEGEKVSEYEQQRNARIQENIKRMQQLGILGISQEFRAQHSTRRSRPQSPLPRRVAVPTLVPPRRSSRLQASAHVSYVPLSSKQDENIHAKESQIICGGIHPEIYSEEHEKLLGSCHSEWVLFQDGFGPNGKRIYDSVSGKTCHQCRQKTLGLHTHCGTCKLVQGQLCGDCLYMRYGENILEVNRNPEWVCPVCRGICNCSLCRTKKGWAPTGCLYKQVKRLGFKSVAHYLILTRRSVEEKSQDDTLNNCNVEDKKEALSPNSASTSPSEDKKEALSPNSASTSPSVVTLDMTLNDGKYLSSTSDSRISISKSPSGDENLVSSSANANGQFDHGVEVVSAPDIVAINKSNKGKDGKKRVVLKSNKKKGVSRQLKYMA